MTEHRHGALNCSFNYRVRLFAPDHEGCRAEIYLTADGNFAEEDPALTAFYVGNTLQRVACAGGFCPGLEHKPTHRALYPAALCAVLSSFDFAKAGQSFEGMRQRGLPQRFFDQGELSIRADTSLKSILTTKTRAA